MSDAVVDALRVLSLLALVAAFSYGFAVRVRRLSVVAAVAASLAYGATYLPAVLGQYSFDRWDTLAGSAAVGAAALALAVWAFLRWPGAVAPALALSAACRLPIPVHRGLDNGAAPEYLFLLVPLYVATVAALIAEALGSDAGDDAGPAAGADVGADVGYPPLWRRDPLRLPIALLVGWAALSTLWSAGSVQAAIRLYSFWLLLPAAYHALWRGVRRGAGGATAATAAARLLSVKALVVLASLLAVVGIDQHFRQWLWLENTNLEATQWQQVIFRVNAIFWDPNMFARFLLVTGLLAGALWFARRDRWRWLALGLAPILPALYFTYSRGVWLVAVIVVALVAWLALGWKRALAVAAALAIVVGSAFVVIRAPAFRKNTLIWVRSGLGLVREGRLELAAPVNQLTGGRYGLMVGGVRMFAARPIAGWGLGSFPAVYERFRPADAPPKLRESHNSVITVAAELGLVGLALFGWVLVAAAARVRDALKGRPAAGGPPLDDASSARPPPGAAPSAAPGAEHPFAVAVAGGLAGILLHSMLYAALIEDPFTWVLLALVPL